MPRAAARLERLGGLLELHIEQGPVLESEGIPIAAVSGTVGIERWRFRFEGTASHAGTTPMDARHDAGRAAANLVIAAAAVGELRSGVATVGTLTLEPGTPTVVPGAAEIVVDLRAGDAPSLAGMLAEVQAAAERIARDNGCAQSAESVWAIDPIEFDPELVALAREACEEVAGSDRVMPSGALHDAAEVAAQAAGGDVVRALDRRRQSLAGRGQHRGGPGAGDSRLRRARRTRLGALVAARVPEARR